MKFQLDHIVIFVEDMDKAVENYENLGFQVHLGGKHPSGTFNALIYFDDGSYLELLSYPGGAIALRDFIKQNPEVSLEHRWGGGPGFVDFALNCDDFDSVVSTHIIEGQRTKPDGTQIKWRLGLSHKSLPFLIDDITPRNLRVLEGQNHANGVIGITDITVVVSDLEEATKQYQQFLSIEPLEIDTFTNRFILENSTITLIESNDNHRILREYLAEREEGDPYAITLRSTKADYTGRLDIKQTLGAHITIESLGVIF